MFKFSELVEEEFRKNRQLNHEMLQSIRQFALNNNNVPQVSDFQLILFLHSCHYSLEKTEKCIESYYRLRKKSPQFFDDKDISLPELKEALHVLFYSILPVRHPSGCRIIYHSLQQYEPSKYVFANGVKLLNMAIDASLQLDGTSPGIIFLFDMKGVSLGHISRLGIFDIRNSLAYLQEGLPVRLVAVHVLNVVPFIDKILFLARPFMKKELFNLLHFHTGDIEKVYEYIPVSCLPCDYGGPLPSVAELHAQHVELLQSFQTFFREEENIRKNSHQKDLELPGPSRHTELD